MPFIVPAREDAEAARVDLSLGLARDARFYNEAVVPGIGGASRVRHFSWSVAGILLKRESETKASAAVVAQALEALGSKLEWSLAAEESRKELPIRGKLAFRRNPEAWTFRELSQQRFYVQITTRQSITRALPERTGLGFTQGSTRFNAMELTREGIRFAETFMNQDGAGRGAPRLRTNLRHWMTNDFNPAGYQGRLAGQLGLRPIPEERTMVRNTLYAELDRQTGFGSRDPRRRIRLAEYFDTGRRAETDWEDVRGLLGWLESQGGESHALDIRTAMAFEDMRAAGVGILSRMADFLYRQGQSSALSICAQDREVQEALDLFRAACLRYDEAASAGGNGLHDSRLLSRDSGLAPVEVLRAMVRRDNRILQVAGERVCKGPLFRTDFISLADSNEDQDADVQSGATAAVGPARLFRYLELWRDCNAQT